ncbi:SMP-30/gluconolactonase/LRE family protein [Flavobacteriaceae bacterium F89]|uniref:SMP-30/gluconolactonase/LRE family protein n=1 Tax=Cerina litoralis TaxID=2874477 RepID=A0AAE3EXQ5_9FLAO|nr:SMP-30/gluconolactonase/LRE family protein [Cerina litoralis]MCG2462833.1 SMP-30/gluconolactonase/LRE family protein [Cerina litoralis]
MSQKSTVIANGAKLQLISSDFSFTEGPAVDKKGDVYFTDQPNDRILKWTPDGKVSVYMDDTGRANGLYFDQKGNLLACADRKNQLWQISPDKKVTVLIYDFEGKKLNGPNDLWVDNKGGVYLTDPFYKRDYWDRTEKEIDPERVYYLTPDRKEIQIVVDDLTKPNGIIGSADGKILYIADIGAGKTYRYTIETNGHLSKKTLFAEMGSDGMTLDNRGNVYLTGKGVTVFDKDGKQIEHIDVPENWTANVTFGGKDQKTLFITASKSVYTLKMKVKGVR